jgi:hypothetical protein
MSDIWKCKMPLKLKLEVFLWLAFQGKLQLGLQLKKMGKQKLHLVEQT